MRVRVGVYVDAYNLYYGMRSHCGRGTSGWRWLDVRKLAESLCGWADSSVERIVYCTALVNSREDPQAYADQDTYLRALQAHRSIDHLELGRYVARAKTAPLATTVGRWATPQIVRPTGSEVYPPGLPLFPKPDGSMIYAKVCVREEKGSDVNVATHLLTDVFKGNIDAAIVISNDSDLALPLSTARDIVPVGTVNPGTSPLAGALRGLKTQGPGGHWWRSRMDHRDFRASQMPDPLGHLRKPVDW